MLLKILGRRRRGQRNHRNRLVCKPTLESLENRRLMYGANAFAWSIIEPSALSAEAVGNVGGSLSATAVQAGNQRCSSQATSDAAAVEIRFLRRQYLALDQNTVVGESLCIAAQDIETAFPESVPDRLSGSQLIDLTPSGQAVAEQTVRATALPASTNTDLSHPTAAQVGHMQSDGPASNPVVASVNAPSPLPANVAIKVGSGAEQVTSSASSPQNSQAAHNEVVIIALTRRAPVVPPGSSGTSGTGTNGTGTNTNGGATTSGNSPITLPWDNQGGSSSGSGQDSGANAGTPSPLSQIPNVLNLPDSSHPAPTGGGPAPSDNSAQPADSPPADTAATIGLGRLLLNAAGSSSTGASGAGHTIAGTSTTSLSTTRALLTSVAHATSSGDAASSMSWPDLVDMAPDSSAG